MSRASWTGVADIAPVCLASQALSMRRRRPISGGAAQTPHLLQPVWTVRIVPLVSLSGVGCGPEASEARAKRTSGHLGSSAVAVLPSRDDKSCLPVVVASERAEVPDLRHSLIGIRKGRRWLSSPLTHSSSKLRFTTAVLRSDALPIERLSCRAHRTHRRIVFRLGRRSCCAAGARFETHIPYRRRFAHCDRRKPFSTLASDGLGLDV